MNQILRKSLGFILVLFLMVFCFSTVVKVKATEYNNTTQFGYDTSGGNPILGSWTLSAGSLTYASSQSSNQTLNGNLYSNVKVLNVKGATLDYSISQENIKNVSITLYALRTTATSSSFTVKIKNGDQVLDSDTGDLVQISAGSNYAAIVSSMQSNENALFSFDFASETAIDSISLSFGSGSNTYLSKVVLSYSDVLDTTNLASINLTNVSLKPGQTGRTTITYNPANATDKAVSYEITNGSEYAEVANDGTITAKAAGIATLTVTPHDTNASAQTCSITVTDYPAPAITVGKTYYIYANDSHGNYQLSGVTNNLGTGVTYATDFPNTEVFPLLVEQGIYVNTVSFKNGNDYLSLNSDGNNLHLSNEKNANSSWLVSINEGVYSVNNIVYQTRRLQFNYNKEGSERFACYPSNQVAIRFYDPTQTTVAISATGTTLYLDSTLSFNISTNAQNPVVTWNSSNTNAATIDSNGVLHPVGIGRTTVKATINEVESNEIEITVLPNHANPITIAQANAIAELVGTTKTTEIYKLDGSITYVDANSLTLTDNSGSILVYKSGHNLDNSFNDREVRVTGKIIKYEGTTNEITDNVTIAFYHTVTFNSNGGSDIASQKILDGGKANRPTPDPTKDGFTFNCWKNGGEIYNFNTNVTQDITLVAEWVGSTGTQILNLLNSTQTYMSLAYKYSVTTPFVSDVLTRSLTEVSGSTYTDWEDKTVNTSAIYKGNSAGSNSSIQLRSSNDSGIVTTTSGGYARKVIVTFEGHTQEGRTIDIYGSDTQYTSPSDLYNNSLQGTKLGSIVCGTNTTLVISGNYQYIGIKSNNSTAYCSTIEIVWGAFGDSDFRLRCGFDNSSFATDLAAISGDATYGIEVSTTSKTERFAQNNELIKTSGDMKYVLVDLGDALTNSNRLDLEFTVKVYVELDEVRYYATNDAMIKTYSVASMIETYYQNEEVKPLILNLYNLLVAMGKIE